MKIAAFLISGLLLATAAGKGVCADDTAPDPDVSFLSRMTIAVPLFTRHYPDNRDFNDNTWGGVLFYDLDNHFSLTGGDFINSYRRNTAFAGLSVVPWNFSLSGVQIDPGFIVAADLNGGYKGHDSLNPLLGALTLKISGKYFDDPQYQFLNRFGLLTTVIPGFGNGSSTAVDFALTFRL